MEYMQYTMWGDKKVRLRTLVIGLVLIIILCPAIVMPQSPQPMPLITNYASVNYKAGKGVIVSNQVITSVAKRTKGVIEFNNSNWKPTVVYNLGDSVCIEVIDYDQNLDPNIKEAITVKLEHGYSGDIETVILNETGFNTGIFHNCITSSLRSVPEDGTITFMPDTIIKATYRDIHDQSEVSEDLALIDPYGIVFDSVTGEPIESAVVSLIDADTREIIDLTPFDPNQKNPVITGPDGKFAFPLVPCDNYIDGNYYPKSYYLDVDPGPNHIFPSNVPDDRLPSGFIIETGSRGEQFSLNEGMGVLNLDIPVDPLPNLSIAKTANKDTAAIGDFVRYTITLNNKGESIITDLQVVDILPHGFQYIKGSSKIGKSSSSDPQFTEKRGIAWTIETLSAGESIEISYQTVVGVDSKRGDGTNKTYAKGMRKSNSILSNIAKKTIKIKEGIFTTNATIIGKVFLDKNDDKVQGKPESNSNRKTEKISENLETEKEHGIPGVNIYMEDGTRVITDKDGKFSIPGVKPGNHVLRMDETTLPEDIKPVATSNRFLLSTTSQFVDLKPSGLFKANFAVKMQEGSGFKDTPTSKPANEETQSSKDKGSISAQEEMYSNLEEDSISAQEETYANLEERIVQMTPDLEFLSPKNETIIDSRHTNILIKAPIDAQIALFVNNQKIKNGRIGKKVINHKAQVTIYEFVSVELPQSGKNQIQALIIDNLGSVRDSKQITVTRIGSPAHIDIIPEKMRIPADGISTVDIKVIILDQNRYIVPYSKTISVASTDGDIIDQDIDPLTGGIQISCDKGTATFTLKAPRKTVEADITVSCNNIKESITYFFPPHLRDMFLVGMGELTIGKGSTSGDYGYIKDEKGFDDGFYAWGRGAAFMKGKVGKGILLTAIYDSDKEKVDELFRESETDLESESKYPIYGDESKLGYEGISSDKLYFRADKDKSYIMYADYHTDIDDTKISAYTRAFNGIKSEVNLERFKLTTFGSYTDHTQVVEKLPGKGIARYYYLNSTPVVEGSEKVVIETRDRQRTEHVIKKEFMNREADYHIDYDMGTIIFKMPIPSRDENFNPIYIIISYESKGNGEKYYIYGGRGILRITDNLELGVTGINEEQEVDDYELTGTDLTLKLPLESTLKAEWAQTGSIFTIDNTYSLQRGGGWSLELKAKPLKPISITGYYRDIDEYFKNDSAINAMPGMEKYGGEMKLEFSKKTLLKGMFFEEKDIPNNMQHRYSSLGIEERFEKTKLEIELSRETSNKTYVSPEDQFNRAPFDNTEEIPDNVTAAKATVETSLSQNISFRLGHKQRIDHDQYSLSQAGLNYKMNKLTKIYVNQEYGRYEERTDTRTIMGVESEVADNTVAYNEYRLDGGSEGERNQHVIGLRNRFLWGEKITGNISLENLSTLSGEERQNEPDAFASSLGLEYLPKDTVKCTTRYEYRYESSEISNLVELSIAYKLTTEHSILLKERYYNDDFKDKGKRIASRTSLGLAYRPIHWDCFNALGKLEFKHENNGTSDNFINSDSFIASVEGVCQTTKHMQIIGKYACKLVRENGLKSYTDLVSGRVIYDLTDRFDLGLEYRVLQSHKVNSLLHGGSAEIGYRIVKNLWLSAGYCFDRFDPDLSSDSYRGEGPYMRIRFKFDENSLKDLKKKNR